MRKAISLVVDKEKKWVLSYGNRRLKVIAQEVDYRLLGIAQALPLLTFHPLD